jgi:hypothetical protein
LTKTNVHLDVMISTIARLWSYWVPTTLLVFAWVSFDPNIRASPKSEILGLILSSKRILLAFRSLCMTRRRECLWRYNSPWAIPSIIWRLLFQFNNVLLVVSVYTWQMAYKYNRGATNFKAWWTWVIILYIRELCMTYQR